MLCYGEISSSLESQGGVPLRLGRRGGNGEGQAWGGQACGRELIMLLGSKVPCGENHKVVEVPRLRLAQTAACRTGGGQGALSAIGWAPPRAGPSRSYIQQYCPKTVKTRLRKVRRRSRGPEGPAGVNAGLLLPGLRSRAAPWPRQSPRSDVLWVAALLGFREVGWRPPSFCGASGGARGAGRGGDTPARSGARGGGCPPPPRPAGARRWGR